ADVDPKAVESRVQYAKKWLERFAPEDLRFSLQKELPEAAATLSPEQRKALALIAENLKAGMTADDLHKLIYSLKDQANLTPQLIFEAIYKSLLGKNKGPRAGFFLASLDPAYVKKRFEEASAPAR